MEGCAGVHNLAIAVAQLQTITCAQINGLVSGFEDRLGGDNMPALCVGL